jgi:hypothetical protein
VVGAPGWLGWITGGRGSVAALQRCSDLQLVDRLRRDVFGVWCGDGVTKGGWVVVVVVVVLVLAWVYILLLPLAGAAELAGLIDHAIGRGRSGV